MITERATVMRLEGLRVWVRPRSVADCERCRAGQGCGGGVLGRLVGDRLTDVEVDPGGFSLAPGDDVLLGLREPVLLRASLMAYGLPLVGLIGGAALAGLYAGAQGDGAQVAGGVLGLLAGLGAARRLAHRDPRRVSAWQPVVLEQLGSGHRDKGGGAAECA
jgi:sigma-E factor negative regulatory protein RseC